MKVNITVEMTKDEFARTVKTAILNAVADLQRGGHLVQPTRGYGLFADITTDKDAMHQREEDLDLMVARHVNRVLNPIDTEDDFDD